MSKINTTIKVAGLVCNVAGLVLGAISQKNELKIEVAKEVAKYVVRK